MSLSAVALTSGGDTANVTSYASAAFTYAADSLVIVCFAYSKTGAETDNPTLTNTGTPLTWTKVEDFIYSFSPQPTGRLTVWAAKGTNPGETITVTMTCPTAKLGAAHVVVEVQGSDVFHGVGQCFIQPTRSVANSGVGTSLTVTLPGAASAADNRTMFFVPHHNSGVYTIPGTWTQLGARGFFTSPSFALQAAWRSDVFDATATMSWATSSQYGGTAFEIKAASGGIIMPVEPPNYQYFATPVTMHLQRKVFPTLTNFVYAALNLVGLRVDRKTVVTPASAPLLSFKTVNFVHTYKLTVTPASALLTFSFVTAVHSYKTVVTPTPANLLTFSNVTFRRNYKSIVTTEPANLLTFSNVTFVRSFKLVVTPTPANLLTFSNVAIRRTYLTVVTKQTSALLTFPDVKLLRSTRMAVFPLGSYGLTLSNVNFSKRYTTGLLTTLNFQFATQTIVVALRKGAILLTGNYPLNFNVVGLIFKGVPEPEPEPIPIEKDFLVGPGRIQPGDRVYVSTQGDMWDLVSLRVYGMQKGSDHYLDKLIEANQDLNTYSQMPGGLYIRVPPLPAVTEVSLVPWKKATIIPDL